MSSIHIEFRCI
uniref:Uncharacterized protein n=1 Tax=Lepeophtheirus salmonis TaxID=72036 RepID=A0A0K2UKC5_LEPSM